MSSSGERGTESHQSTDLSQPPAFHHPDLPESQPLSRSRSPVLRQRCGHGRPERSERHPGSAASSAGPVSRPGVCNGFLTLPGDVHLFQRRPVEHTAGQEESEENELNGAEVSNRPKEAIFVSRTNTVKSIFAVYARESSRSSVPQ